MATSTTTAGGSDVMEAEILLQCDVVSSCTDFKGREVFRSKTGCWKSASFMIAVEMAERFAYYGISSNLITYLTGPLGQPTASAAASVNAWSGTAALSSLLGAFIADSFFGRYRTVVIASLLYILGLGCLTIAGAINPSQSECKSAVNNDGCHPPQHQIIFFFCSLYLIALAQGGHKPCLQAFGADQFDEDDQNELKSKSSFFNWWNFCICVSILVGMLVLSYIQDNLSWELGFGIPCIVMSLSLLIFLFGTTTYRFHIKRDQRNPFVRLGRVLVKAAKNWRASPPVEEEAQHVLRREGDRLGFLDKALLADPNCEKDVAKVCTITDVEDAKAILKLLPICLACLPFAIVHSQSTTLFTKQGTTMDRHITTSFHIPAAGLQSFTPASIVLFLPFYEKVLVPRARAMTKKPSGISMLQRIGAGLFLGIISMIIAGFIERKRLATAHEHGLVDLPKAMVPMRVWWLVPQYLVLGIAEVLAFVGLQEFFYDQVPAGLKSMGLAMSFGVAGVGGFLSSSLVSFVDSATSRDGRDSWFSNNLNRAHLDYFYWALATLNACSFALYIYIAKSYAYRHRVTI